jgi:iron complex outermembrane receptor protein
MVRRAVARLFTVGCLFLGGSAPGGAAEPPESQASPQVPPVLLLSATRIPDQTLEAWQFPGNATVLTAEDLVRSGATTLQEAISKVEGVTWLDARGFGIGSDASLSLRGIVNGSRANVLVLVDGVRQNRVTGDEIHWQAIPLGDIERIEILRGGSGTIYGEGALAGVINIFTKQGGERPLEGDAGVEIGSFGWQHYRTGVRGRSGAFTYGTTYARRLLEGYREFSASRNTTVTAHAGVEPVPGGRLRLNVRHSEDTTGFPGGLTPAEAEARRQQAVISRAGIFDEETDEVSGELLLGPWSGTSLAVNAFWRRQVSDSLRSRLFTVTPSQGLSVRSSHHWSQGALSSDLITGLELVDDKAATGTHGSRTDESDREGYGAYLEETLTLWDRLALVGGFRYDKARFEEDIIAFDSNFNEVNYVGTLRFEGKSPKVGVAYEVIPQAASVFAGYSRPYKSPNVDDFASRSAEFQGNVALQAQQGHAYEIGGRTLAGPLHANVTWFYTRIDDEILFVQGVPGNAFIFQNQNHDTCRVGFESALRFAPEEAPVRGSLAYTFVNGKFRKGAFADSRIPGAPEHTLQAGAGVRPLPALWIDLDWQLVHDMVRINDVSNALPEADNYGVLNLLVQYDFAPERIGGLKGHAFLKFTNLTNEEYVTFQSSNGHTLSSGAGQNPMPPFGVMGGVRVEF